MKGGLGQGVGPCVGAARGAQGSVQGEQTSARVICGASPMS